LPRLDGLLDRGHFSVFKSGAAKFSGCLLRATKAA
jgi:hypothetical protein